MIRVVSAGDFGREDEEEIAAPPSDDLPAGFAGDCADDFAVRGIRQ
jgi:hypothetical protein